VSLSKEDAATALNEIGAASVHMRRLRYYRDSAPIFMMWGVVLFVCNAMIDINWRWVAWTWLPVFPAFAISIWFGQRRKKLNPNRLSAEERASQPNFAIIALGAFIPFIAILNILWPLDYKQLNAVYSLFFAGAYTLAGAWLGWRVVFIGVTFGIGTLIGYHFITHHYFLWMAFVSGGALLGGGLWLRKM